MLCEFVETIEAIEGFNLKLIEEKILPLRVIRQKSIKC
jgi:hypothetical protein